MTDAVLEHNPEIRREDLRTGIERSDTQKVLDGDLDEFVEASLKAGLEAGSKRVDAA